MNQKVHVFLSSVHWADEETATRLQQLPDADQRRASRYTHPMRLQSFVASRYLLRHALSTVGPYKPDEWHIAYQQQRLALDPQQTVWHTSLSHSQHWVACVLAATPHCGVDIECRVNKPRLMAIAQRFFHPQEYQLLLTEDEPSRLDIFLDLWTRKEACVKAWHRGLAHHLASVQFDQQGLAPCQFPAEFAHLPLSVNHWQHNDWQLAVAAHLPAPDWQLHHLTL
jgi:4'-phosphopantetheinyl transferase